MMMACGMDELTLSLSFSAVVMDRWHSLYYDFVKRSCSGARTGSAGVGTGAAMARAGPDFLVAQCEKNMEAPINYKNIKSQIANRHDK
jgi:hypothetical protein